MRQMIGWMMAGLLAGLPAASVASNGETATGWALEAIPWAAAGANGTRFALLEGRRDVAGGSFTYAFFIPAGVWDAPHIHTATARVFVASGVLSIGYGDTLDRARVKSYPAGSIVIVPAGMRHFDGSDRDTVIIGVAQGPWSTAYLDGSKPASAGTPVQ